MCRKKVQYVSIYNCPTNQGSASSILAVDHWHGLESRDAINSKASFREG